MESDETEQVQTTADRIYDVLRERAITYQFRPGERINEVELAKQLEVSRTPLREALNRLTTEGFLTTHPNKGFFGRTLDPNEIFDLYELRSYLEQAAAVLACRRATEQELQEISDFLASLKGMDDSRPSIELLKADEEFHLRLVKLSKNESLVGICQSIASKIHFVRWIDSKTRNRGQEHHAKIVGLIKERNEEEVSKYISDHILTHYNEIVELIKGAVAEIYLREKIQRRDS